MPSGLGLLSPDTGRPAGLTLLGRERPGGVLDTGLVLPELGLERPGGVLDTGLGAAPAGRPGAGFCVVFEAGALALLGLSLPGDGCAAVLPRPGFGAPRPGCWPGAFGPA